MADTDSQQLSEWLAFAHVLADTAGSIIRPYFRSAVEVHTKADQTPVTIADRETEMALRELINSRYPEHGVFGEEFDNTTTDQSLVWVLDPIDGTKNFISGIPLFGTLIGLVHNGVPVLGILDSPILRERWVGATGMPTTLNGQLCRTRGCTTIDKASLFATSPYMFNEAERVCFDKLAQTSALTRFGADCYAYALLAGGFVDLVVEADMAPYDILALVRIIEGAGGLITDWQGSALGLHFNGRVVAAATPQLHKQTLAYLRL